MYASYCLPSPMIEVFIPTKTRRKRTRQSVPSRSAEILDVRMAAELLTVSPETVYELFKTGELPGREVGRKWIITKAAAVRPRQGCQTSARRSCGGVTRTRSHGSWGRSPRGALHRPQARRPQGTRPCEASSGWGSSPVRRVHPSAGCMPSSRSPSRGDGWCGMR